MTIGDSLLIAGGRVGGVLSAVVDVYDDRTGTWSTASLSSPRSDFAAAVVGRWALFAAGATSGTTSTNVVDVFDAETSTWSTTTLSEAKFGLSATTVGTKVLIAGGGSGGPVAPTGITNRVEIYDASIGPPSDPAAWSMATLSRARGLMVAATVGSEALFAGGLDFTGGVSDVDIYDDVTGLWSTAALSEARILSSQASAVVGTRAYFAGGQVQDMPPVMTDRIDVYDSATGGWSIESLSSRRGIVAALSVGNTVLFAGGALDGFVPTDVVDVLNAGTGTFGPTAHLSSARAGMAATTIGGKAFFAGGAAVGGASSVVDVFDANVGTRYCSPATVNSSGLPAELRAIGDTRFSENNVTLVATSVPALATGYFLASRTQGSLVPVGAQGTLCLGGSIGRYVGRGQVMNSGPAGSFSLTLNLNLTPGPGGFAPAHAGETWHFQGWFRDQNPGLTSNFTDAMSVTLN